MKIIEPHPGWLRKRRKRIIKDSGITETELRDGFTNYTLTTAQHQIVDEIETIDYLLGVVAHRR